MATQWYLNCVINLPLEYSSDTYCPPAVGAMETISAMLIVEHKVPKKTSQIPIKEPR